MNALTRVLLAAILLGGAGKASGDATSDDFSKMQGDWRVVSMTAGIAKVPDDEAQALFRTVEGDKYSVSRYSKTIGKGVFKLDATKTPKTIDSTPAPSAGQAKPILGIYEFDGERLKICNAAPGKPRPTNFKLGLDHTLIVWEPEPK